MNPSLELTEATVQEIQLELIRRTQFNAFDGEWIAASLEAHSELWQAVLLDRLCVGGLGELGGGYLIKLRDLPENLWNTDTLFILTADGASARRMASIAKEEGWAGEVQVYEEDATIIRALGTGRSYGLLSIWWD